jgi:uncharacterized LabA/DUF88 family protein
MKLSKYFGNGKYLKFNRKIFFENLARSEKLECKNIFYYTAAPFQSERSTLDEKRRKDGYDKFILSIKEEGIIVREGRCQRLKINDKFKYSQKSVDILLAMDLMSVPIKFSHVKKIIFISLDSDFVPIVKFLSENNIKTILYAYYEKKRNMQFSVGNYLIKSVYKYVCLTKEDFENAKFNEVENENL